MKGCPLAAHSGSPGILKILLQSIQATLILILHTLGGKKMSHLFEELKYWK